MSGEEIFRLKYARRKADGSYESIEEAILRVADYDISERGNVPEEVEREDGQDTSATD
jgi:hypothetical protein